jgi:hypothetical protein
MTPSSRPGLDLVQDRALVLGRELAASGLGRDLRVGDRGRSGAADSTCLSGNCLRFDLSTEREFFLRPPQ